MKIFYFTATGNSLYIAKQIGGELLSIPQMINKDKKKFKADAIGFVFPCYSVGIPNIVKDFIEQSSFEADYFFVVMTYGSMAAAGLSYLERVGEKANISFNYTAEILMVDNFLPMYRIEDQLEKEASKNIEANANIIVQDIKKQTNRKMKIGPGSKMISALAQATQRFQNGDWDKKFTVTDNCTKCGICQRVCPKGNIILKKIPEYLHNCESCLSCIHLCPQNAIHLKGQKSAIRFKNQHITVQEIISANNQGRIIL